MENKTFVFGHKNPDTDSIMSSMVMANLENQLGNNAKAVRLGNINKETEFVFKYLGIEAPELISDVENGQNVILVDHNESTQSVNNLQNANIQKVVDHHTMNFVAPYQLYYRAEPVGCTATVLYKMYKEYDIAITKNIATMMLSAIISDTLLFKSPTCTDEDIKVAKELAKIAQIDIESYGMDMLKAGTDLNDFSAEELINIDAKEFNSNGIKYAIAQVNTVSIPDVLKRKEEIEEAINNAIKEKGLKLFLFAITDIVNSNSTGIVLGERTDIVEKTYKVENNCIDMPGVVSRKKQIIPVIEANI